MPRLLFASLILGIVFGMASPKSTAAGNCDAPDSCQFDCTIADSGWGIGNPNSDDEEGVWVVVEAHPVDDDSGTPPSTYLDWHDQSSPSWAPLQIQVYWRSSTGLILSEQKTVSKSGTCNAGGSQYPSGGTSASAPHIRCHDFIVSSSASTLCDAYSGIWERVLVDSDDSCVDYIRYGFDMATEVVWNGTTFCWYEMDVFPYNPWTAAGDLRATEDCAELEYWDYVNSGGIDNFRCSSNPTLSRGGQTTGNQIELWYRYDAPQ